jgi:5'-nucleotidase
MCEWWEEHLRLMIECGMEKSVVDDIVRKRRIRFREGALKLFDLLHDKNIPILVFSAAIGDMITGSLKAEDRLYNNVHVISNAYEYDADGKVVAYEGEIVHTFNKNESMLKGTPYESIAASRKNVILLGDTLGDLGMASGASHDTLLSVGFLNEDVEKELPAFNKEYDVVITDDGSMDWVLDVVKSVK